MKIAVTCTAPDLEAPVDPRFGRSQYILIVDPETLAFEVIQNPNVMAMSGAGIQSAQLIASHGAEVVLSGNYGPNAAQTLHAIGIQMIPGVMGTVREAVEQFKRGELQPVSQATVPPYFGVGGAPDMGGANIGGGMGMGRGGGMRGGGGLGRGGGMSRGGGMGRRGGMGGGRGMGGGQMGVPPGTGFGQAPWQTPMPPPVAPPGVPASAPQQDMEDLKQQAQMLSRQLQQINQRIEAMEKKPSSPDENPPEES
jgi:predicted Fe-Mo cluster-binding NifX family protein